jgi:hypothetical protein
MRVKNMLRCGGVCSSFLLCPLLTLILGSYIEEYSVRNSDSKLSDINSYNNLVCGKDSSGNISTFNRSDYHKNFIPLHCGSCGTCSNNLDIHIYKDTNRTMTPIARNCAAKSLFRGKNYAKKCMARTGMTLDCVNCWANNIMCDIRFCKFTCILSILFGQRNTMDNKLNSCLKCDEVMCGKEFLTCSGANRRRLDIITDIDRPSVQMCNLSRL